MSAIWLISVFYKTDKSSQIIERINIILFDL